ncbi:hypothetical protein M0L22_RS11850 [Providencia rettgeri]|nr:hypothetical protein [Providencia rettgeri]
MTEELKQQDEMEPVKKDYVVIDLSVWANQGVFVGATISVKGIMYSGTVISGREWCKRHIDLYENAEIGEHEKAGMKSYFEQLIKEVYNDENVKSQIDKNHDPDYIHMSVTSISGQKRTGDKETLWRFRISEIDGIFLGSLQLI